MRVGRAQTPMIVGLVMAFVLMGISIFVAITMGGDEPSESSQPTDGAVVRCLDAEDPARRGGTVLVYFMCVPPPADPRPVIRDAAGEGDEANLRSALEDLLRGPKPSELEARYVSAFPAGSQELLIGVEVRDDGLAIVDFVEELRTVANLNTSTQRFMVFATLGATIFGFESVAAIEYRIEGSCERFARHFETTCVPFLRDQPEG